MKKVLITIPAYNEEKTLGKVLQCIRKVMDPSKYKYSIQVVDDGSRDRTAEVARKNGVKVVRHPVNYGLAEAFRTEISRFLKSDADIVVHTDADGQYLASDIPKLLSYVEKGYDLVLGDRFRGGIEGMPLIKRWGNKAFSRTISRIINFKVNDCQTGFRAFTREVAEKVPITSNHTYTQEQIIRAVRLKFRIKEVPSRFKIRGAKTKSRLMKNPFEYAAKAWINILRIYRDYEPLKFFSYAALPFFIISLALAVQIIYMLFTGQSIDSKVPTIILIAIFFLTSLQIALFGFLADMHKK